MKVCIIGTGYVGLVVGTCLAEMGNDVICVDNNENKIKDLYNGKINIYEPGLDELIIENVTDKRLSFTTDIKMAVEKSLICFIAVGTPQKEDGSADLQYVYQVAESIGKSMNSYKVIVDKSTVPVGTSEIVAEIIKKYTNEEFDIVSNPEFLKQGAAVNDFLHPNRIVIGTDSKRAVEIMQELYSPFLRTGNPIITMDANSAEMTKYAANSFLAVKISFANEIANICEKVGANVDSVRIGMCTDERIGSSFLFPGLGYGGSCFPKDIKALIKTGANNNYDAQLLKSADNVNKFQRKNFINKIIKHFGENLTKLTFAIWGLSFKPKTNDMREAPSIDIIKALLEMGANIKVYDPKAIEIAKTIFGNKVYYAKNSFDTLYDADCLLLLTEWNEFRRPNFEEMKSIMKQHVIIDGRNIYDEKRMKRRGFKYYYIGKC